MTLFLIYLLLMAVPAAGAAVMKKRSGLLLPLGAFSIITCLYIGALANRLEQAVYAVCVMGTLLWVFALVFSALKMDGKGFSARLFSPGHGVYAALFLFCAIAARGMQIHRWDEFSHWAYSVQEMLLHGEIYTGATSDVLFPHYPPAMPLWQYLGQQVHAMLTGECVFTGEVAYTLSPALAFTLFSPFLDKLSWRRGGWVAAAFACIVGLPVIVYTDYYELLYIDGFLGMLSGAVLAMIALNKWRKPLGAATLSLMLGVLVLTKESGLFFAAVALAYLFTLVLLEKKRAALRMLICTVGVTAAAYVSWQWHLHARGIAGGTGVDMSGLMLLLTGCDTSGYRVQVVKNFIHFLFTGTMRVTLLGLPLTHFLSIVLLITLSALMLRGKDAGKRRVLLSVFSGVCSVAYLCGLLMLYLFHFGEYGGLALVSAARYTKTLTLCFAALLTAGLLYRLGKKALSPLAGMMVAVMLLLPSWDEAYAHIAGQNARESQVASQRVAEAGQLIGEKTGGSADDRQRVYLILQENDDHAYYGIRYYARPYASVNWLNWHLGEESYSAAYNVWQMPPDAWVQTLCEGYDYVYVGTSDAYFVKTYGHLFVDGVEENTLYSVQRSGDGSVLLVKI